MRYRVASTALLALITVAAGLAPAYAQPRPGPVVPDKPRYSSGDPAPVAKDADAASSHVPQLDSGYGPTAAQRSAMAAAAEKARRTGKPVAVGALMSPEEQVTANPTGGFMLAANPKPVRTEQHGRWVPVDLTLHRNSDNTLSPAATAYGTVSFSGGGNEPLTTTRSGQVAMSVSWPGKLPAPVVNGSTATYRSVLPSVDLVVSATEAGGFTDTLVVKSAAAANNPALRSLHLNTHVTGGRLARSSSGTLVVDDSHGHEVMAAASPLMWDSNTAMPAQPHATAARTAAAKVAADPSDTGHPGMAARVAPVNAGVSQSTLSLTPDTRMLAAPSTVFPVYIDPTFNWHPNSPAAPTFAEIKKGCPSTSFYKETNAHGDYGQLGVGYNTWGGCAGQEHATYQWNLSSAIWNAQINTATVNATEVYSAACSGSYTVNLHWSGGIGSGTTWNNRPSYNSYSTSASYARSYNPSYCPGNNTVSHALNVLTPIRSDVTGHASSFAVTLSEDSAESSHEGNGFSRFSDNPSLQIFYNIAPQVPNATTMSEVSGAANLACVTAAPYPAMGKTIYTTPPVLKTKVSDTDGDGLQATFQYWLDGSTTYNSGLSADNLSSGSNATYSLPPGFVSGLTDGQVVDWQAKVTDGQATTAYASSPICHFTVDSTAPDAPSVISESNRYPDTSQGGGAGAAAGTAGTFDLATKGSASKFVYRLDVPPPATNPTAAEIAPAANNAANISVTPYAPGPHTLWVYATDSAGNNSGTYGYPFIAAGDPTTPCASLAACLNNTGVSSDTNMAQADLDGSGNSLSATDLTNAGWTSGGKVSVDGATFTLPAFGAGQKDNVLAANQKITYSGSGNALEFLTTGTAWNANATSPGAIAGNTTAPYVREGTSVVNTYCFSGTNSEAACAPSGTLTYTDGTSSSYILTVPDWASGFASSIAAVTLPHRNNASGQTAGSHRLYVFSVPIDASKTIASVTLPDVSSHLTSPTEALHIFGMATRNTTTGTPEVNGTTAAPPSGQTWTGAWGSPTEAQFNAQGTNFSNQTFRLAAKPSVSGSTVRIKLDNAIGDFKLTLGHVTVAADSGTETNITGKPTSTPVSLSFGGSQSVTIPQGGMVYSDPLTFPVAGNRFLLISFQLSNNVPYLVEHPYANTSYQWVSAPGSGDKTTDTTGTPFSATGATYGWFTNLVTGLDVTAGRLPTQAVLGDGLTDPAQPKTHISANQYRLPDILGDTVSSTGSPYGTVAAGIESNELMTDYGQALPGGTYLGGVSALARLDRDVLDLPGLNHVVVTEGLEDLLFGSSNTDLEANGYTALVQQLQGWGISTTLTSLTPCDTYAGDGSTINDPCTSAVDSNRTSVNAWLDGFNLGGPWSTPPVYFADFDAALAVPDTANGEEKLSSKVDTGDHVNITAPGFAAQATSLLSPHDSWALDDGSGITTAGDTAPNNTQYTAGDPTAGTNTLTLGGTTTWATDATRGQVLSLDGATGYAASDSKVLNTAGSYSVSAWVDISSLPTRNATVASQGGAQNSPFSLQYNYTQGSKPSWALSLATSDTAGSAVTLAYAPAATANAWTHLVGTYNAVTHTAQIYVNGALAGTATGVTSWSSANAFSIGCAKSGGGYTDFFPGLVSNVQTWNYALNTFQVTALYQQIP